MGYYWKFLYCIQLLFEIWPQFSVYVLVACSYFRPGHYLQFLCKFLVVIWYSATISVSVLFEISVLVLTTVWNPSNINNVCFSTWLLLVFETQSLFAVSVLESATASDLATNYNFCTSTYSACDHYLTPSILQCALVAVFYFPVRFHSSCHAI